MTIMYVTAVMRDPSDKYPEARKDRAGRPDVKATSIATHRKRANG